MRAAARIPERATEPSALDTIHARSAVRSYKPDVLDEATIRKLLDAAVHAPTAIHEEPWEFVVVQDKAVLRRLSDRAKALAGEEAKHHELLRAPGAAPPSTHTAAHMADPGFNIFYNAGTLIVICGKPLSPFVTADCWLAAENLMLAACATGLGTCCIGLALPALNTAEVKQELGIPAASTAVAAIIAGVPSGATPVVPRKPPEILRWIR